MKPLGIDLAKLIAGEPLPADYAPDCPGAKLRLLRSDFDVLVQGREHLSTKRQDLPVDGYGDARVRCTNVVADIPTTTAGTRQFYGLCHSCSSLEANNRETLRERARQRGDR